MDIHKYDNDQEETTQREIKGEESANEDNDQKKLDQQIRNSPVAANITIQPTKTFGRQTSQQPTTLTQHSTKPTMTSTATTTTATATTTPTPSRSKTTKDIANVF